MNKVRYLLKNTGILILSNFSSKILVFLLIPLYTSVLSTKEYGIYDLAIETATLFYPILTFNIVDAVMRFTMEKNTNKLDVASIGMKFLVCGAVMFGIGMYFLSITKIWKAINGLEGYIFLYYISFIYNQFQIQFAKGLERVKDMGIAGVISTLVTVSFNILFLLVFKWGLVGFFMANILAQAISALYLSIRLKIWKYIHLNNTNVKLKKEMLNYSTPLIASGIGWWVNSAADKYIVAGIMGIAFNGLLSVAYKIPQIINTLQAIFIQAWQISAIKEYGENNTAVFYGNTFQIINLLMCMAGSILIMLTRFLAKLLYANDFYDAWRYVPFLLIASVLNCAAGLLGPILSAQKNSKSMMWSAIIGAISNIVLNIVLVNKFGVQGATIATVISSFIIYYVRKRAVGDDIKIDNYNIIILTWCGLCIQAVVEIYALHYFWQIIIMAILLAINFSTINKLWIKCKKGLFKRIK